MSHSEEAFPPTIQSICFIDYIKYLSQRWNVVSHEFSTALFRRTLCLQSSVFSLHARFSAPRSLLGSNESWNSGLEFLICQWSSDNGQRWMPFDRILPFKAVLDGMFPLPRDRFP
jgi:hypothetical protein